MPDIKTLADAWKHLKKSAAERGIRRPLDEGDEALFYAGAMACFSLMFIDNEMISQTGKELQRWTADHKADALRK